MKARVRIMLKPSVLDAQGQTIQGALARLGFGEVEEVRVGKVLEVRLRDGLARAEAERRVDEMCRRLLANPVIEDFAAEYED